MSCLKTIPSNDRFIESPITTISYTRCFGDVSFDSHSRLSTFAFLKWKLGLLFSLLQLKWCLDIPEVLSRPICNRIKLTSSFKGNGPTLK